jgi:hypothetical protein
MMEFEALVPVGRWKGFGGVTNFNGAGFECGYRRGDQISGGVRDLARAYVPPGACREAGDRDRSHLQWPPRHSCFSPYVLGLLLVPQQSFCAFLNSFVFSHPMPPCCAAT